MANEIILLDSEGLSQATRGDRSLGVVIGRVARRDARVATTAMTLIEAYDQRVKKAAWQWTMSRIQVYPVTHELADLAVELLAGTGLHGHRHAIDAVLAAVALSQSAYNKVTILTSDQEDMRALCGGRVAVIKI